MQTSNTIIKLLNQLETSPSADVVRLYVNVQVQVKALSTGTSSSRTTKKVQKNS